ncbi:hypothetical protein G5B38_14085 [Pseudohalocynthiibacter aestuariivivens]|uniref:DUF4239 domain-containing protein n=1 Tax=Roseovarius pelagicus TaxID=2980108 RepID=A0ABY6DI34_9RHOB|nr:MULTISPECIES: hypothetical protein [Rhodobacterales]QIE46558.1 hypothetical protein G5B38_14085 [Pseudohalocynthiibacter aestuariivivens]UXX84918.1 hypothetical protein N7U68_09860 [Roseovarius pelagicus]
MIGQRELMYDIDSIHIAVALMILMLIGMAVGYLIGQKRQRSATDELRSQATAVQGSLLGLLALLLGFTFSLALSRHDDRSGAVVSEANAIGTAWLRIDYLPDAAQDEARSDLRRYLRLRVEAGEVSADNQQRRDRLVANAEAAFAELWAQAAEVARSTGGPATVAYGNALNDMIDALGSRDAAIERHVPEVVLMMMFLTFILSGTMLGYSSGVAGTRPATPVYLMVGLIVLLVFMIIDLDRPRRGLIAVDQTPMRGLLAAIDTK